MSVQPPLLNFAGTLIASFLQAFLLVLSVRKSGQRNSNYEHKFRALKYGRTVTYAVLAACQAALVLWRSVSHWPHLAWDVDGSQTLVLAVYVFTLAVLCAFWRKQLAIHLSTVLLVALLEPGLLFWADITAVHPDGTFDQEHVARVILHCMQFVLLLCLLVAEVIIQQHQLLQKSGFGSSGGLPVSALVNGSGTSAYEKLPGSAAEAEGKQQQKPKEQQHRRHFSPWRPGDSRWHMAASAFHYVWPTEHTLKLRLLLCLLLVLSERVINLAAPIAFKHMVEVLSAAASTSAGPAPDQQQHPLVAGMRQLLMAVTGAGDTMQQQQQHPDMGSVLHAVAANSSQAAPAGAWAMLPRALHGNVVLAPFWVLFYPWVFIYLGAFFLRGGSGSEGLLANLRDILWIPITQAAFRRISNDVFGHLLELDLNFHVHRKTGQIMRILDRGTSSIQNMVDSALILDFLLTMLVVGGLCVLSQPIAGRSSWATRAQQDTVSIILFNVMPQLIDILVACTYLASALKGPWVALIVLFTVGSYVPLTLLITEQRGKVRKVMNALDNERESRATDMLLNYETIKYFCAEGPELNGYDAATRKYQAAEYWQMAFLSLLSLVQSLVVWLGLAAGLIYCIWGSSRGRVSVGDTVLFISMMQQLYVPLTFFGSYYRQVTKALIDMENMFELLATKPRVQDDPDAATLQVSSGTVEFKQVVFSYNPSPGVAPVLRGLSFLAAGGHSLAVVGSTGSGKSTLLRLLLRFYDPQSGSVCIDRQDIRHCTQTSVRGAIGVVPQDCVLFNDTIMYNIRYGRPAASDDQVFEAAQVSHIHDHLSRFPQGYSTRVGERGLRLSGGEKQRVAFARAVLKSPAIMVLDEATSSLDSLTERLIQDSLAAIRGRCTQVIVAHRLSTIMDADQILVLAKGQVVECGSHAALVAAGGLYASMWARQQDSTSAAPSPAPKLAPGSGFGKDATDGSNSNSTSSNDRNKADLSSLNGSSRTQPQLTEVQEANIDEGVETRGDSIDAESRGSVGGVQSPPPSLPPLPRLQRRLHMQPHGQRAGTGGQQGSGVVSGSASRPSRQPRASADACGEDTSTEDAAGGAEDGGQRSRSVSKLRCNSSCGHGRHANFWSREQVDNQSEAEAEDDPKEQQRSDDDDSQAAPGARE